VLVRGVDPVDVVRLPVPEGLMMVVVVPEFVLETRKARSVLPEHVPLQDLVRNTANVASFVSACYSGDVDLLGRCMTDDVITRARAALIPGAESVMRAALGAGAIATSISGAGPAVFALSHALQGAQEAGARMAEAFSAVGLGATVYVSPLDCPGVRRLP
jgi:homoserine kinase